MVVYPPVLLGLVVLAATSFAKSGITQQLLVC